MTTTKDFNFTKLIKPLEHKLNFCNTTIRMCPDQPSAYHRKVDILEELGDITANASYYDEALKTYEIATGLFPDDKRFIVL